MIMPCILIYVFMYISKLFMRDYYYTTCNQFYQALKKLIYFFKIKKFEGFKCLTEKKISGTKDMQSIFFIYFSKK